MGDIPATLLSACVRASWVLARKLHFHPGIMAEKQSSKDALKLLLQGRLDPIAAREITEAVEERVLRDLDQPPQKG